MSAYKVVGYLHHMSRSLHLFTVMLLMTFCSLSLHAAESIKWQQQVDYKITANVDSKLKRLDGNALITYTNNSPTALKQIVFELPQQLFRKKGITYQGRLAGTSTFDVFSSRNKQLAVKKEGTFYYVNLDQTVKPLQQIQLSIRWDLQFIDRQHVISPRSGVENITDETYVLAAAQWFPRVLGFDQKHGWDALAFNRNGEFHLEVGNYDVVINLPAKELLTATGELVNANQVFTSNLVNHYEGKLLNKTELSSLYYDVNKSSESTKSWHFKAKKVRDFSFAFGNDLVWLRQTLDTTNDKTNINVFLPNNGRWLWHHYGVEAIAHTIDFLDSSLAPFPYKNYSLVNIKGLGMEYPGMTFVGFRGPNSLDMAASLDAKPKYSRTQLYDVIGGTIHEVTHSYFPMLVNTNERREGFLDEGLTSYLSYLVEQAWSQDFQSFYGAPSDVIPVMKNQYDAPITLADKLSSKLDSHYHIPATAWHILGSQVLKPYELLTLLNHFVIQNKHQRVYFSDLVTYINNNTDVDLTSFFYDWFESGKAVDLAVDIIESSEGEHQIKITDLGGIKVPFSIKVMTKTGEIKSSTFPYENWGDTQDNSMYLPLSILRYHSLSKVVIDVEQVSGDINRSNNVWLKRN